MAIGGSSIARHRVNKDRRDPHLRIDDVIETLAQHDARLARQEEVSESITSLNDTLESISKHLKRWGPIILTAAVSSGIFGQQWERFLSAVVNSL